MQPLPLREQASRQAINSVNIVLDSLTLDEGKRHLCELRVQTRHLGQVGFVLLYCIACSDSPAVTMALDWKVKTETSEVPAGGDDFVFDPSFRA